MPDRCETCTHRKRRIIDKEIVAGGNLKEISRVYGISYNSVWRHSKKHIAYQLETAQRIRDEQAALDLYAGLEDHLTRAEEFLQEAKANGSHNYMQKWMQEIRQTYQLVAQMRHAEAGNTDDDKERLTKEEWHRKTMVQGNQDLQNLSNREVEILHKLLNKAAGNITGQVLPPPAPNQPEQATRPAEKGNETKTKYKTMQRTNPPAESQADSTGDEPEQPRKSLRFKPPKSQTIPGKRPKGRRL